MDGGARGPVPYFHIVFTLPAEIGDIAYQNKAAIYDLLLKASFETMLAIAADPKHLGGRVGITAVFHTWGSAMTHHPRTHMIVPGGGISPEGDRWIAPVFVLSRLVRHLMLEKLSAAQASGIVGVMSQITSRSPFTPGPPGGYRARD